MCPDFILNICFNPSINTGYIKKSTCTCKLICTHKKGIAGQASGWNLYIELRFTSMLCVISYSLLCAPSYIITRNYDYGRMLCASFVIPDSSCHSATVFWLQLCELLWLALIGFALEIENIRMYALILNIKYYLSGIIE